MGRHHLSLKKAYIYPKQHTHYWGTLPGCQSYCLMLFGANCFPSPEKAKKKSNKMFVLVCLLTAVLFLRSIQSSGST